MVNISGHLSRQLPHNILNLIHEIGTLAAARREAAYLVGGSVRDILLQRPGLDLDLAIEGKAISLAQHLANSHGWNIRKHPRFGTAKLYWEDYSIDFVTTRSETYSTPGALPTVQHGSIYEDLARRDFTINALAVSLNPDLFGDVLDPHDGQSDIAKGLIRILHDDSYIDDPTRIFRAIRYEQRLGFMLEKQTQELIKMQIDHFDNVTGERVWHELEMILQEDYPEKVINRASELGIIQQLIPSIAIDEEFPEKCHQVRMTDDGSISLPSVWLALLCFRFSEVDLSNFISRFKPPRWATRVLRDTVKLKKAISSLERTDPQPSEVFKLLRHYAPESIVAISTNTDSNIVKRNIELYLTKLRHIKPILNGEDLKQMGVKQGKQIGQILAILRAARLDNRITSRQEEEALVRAVCKR